MDYQKSIATIKELIKNKDYEKAENMLLEIISQAKCKVIEDENNIYYSINNYVEDLLFWNLYKPQKKRVNPDINYSEVYYYLGYINVEEKNFGKAQEYFKKGLEWNPLDVPLMFEQASLYRNLGDIERFKAEIEKAQPFIYESMYMSKFLRELGWYYIEKRVYDLANALYTKSIMFADTELARNELAYIAKQENRQPRFSTKDEMVKLFRDYNISSGFNKNTFNWILEEYNRLMEESPELPVVKQLSQILYDITLDKKFMTYYDLNDEKTGVKITVPDTWKYMDKSAYEQAKIAPNTVFFLLLPSGETVNFACDRKCNEEQLEEAVKLNIASMEKTGVEIEGQYCTSGNKSNRELFVKVNKNENIVRLFQVYRVVNGYLFCASWQVTDADIELNKLLVDINNSYAMGVVNSLKPIDESSNKQTTNEVAKQDIEGENEKESIQYSIDNSELESLIKKFNKNEIEEDEFINSINKIKNQIEIIRVFRVDGEIKDGVISKGSKLIEVLWNVKDKERRICFTSRKKSLANKPPFVTVAIRDKFINLVKDCVESNQELQINLNDDTSLGLHPIVLAKFLQDDNVNKEIAKDKKEEIKTKEPKKDSNLEYTIKLKDGTKFKFYFPEDLGEYAPSKFNNIFEIKQGNTQKIRVMVNSCKQEEFENSAKEWIKKNEKDAKMEMVAYRKERINNIPVEVYELKFVEKKDVANRIYKIGFVNNCRVIISGGLVKGKEDIINHAFEKIEFENIPVEKAPKKEERKPIKVHCPVCNTDFELKWNVPDTEKTFYCKCPNCGMEIKKGNPNYKREETITTNNNKEKIITYLINVLKQKEKIALSYYEKFNQYEDIVNEFANCISGEQFNYSDDGIVVEGYSAKSLKEKVGNKLSDLGVYNYLIYLRENPNEAKKDLAAGLPVK